MRTRIGLLTAFLASAGLMTSTPSTRSEPSTHTVLIQGFEFAPARLEVTAGDTVIWKNQDIVPHTATAQKAFDSKGIDTGKSWTYVARQKGAFPYICTYHPTMTAELIVR